MTAENKRDISPLYQYFKNSENIVRQGNPYQIRGFATYDNAAYGIYNMGNNVKEWMIDEYSNNMKITTDPQDLFTKNGYTLPSDEELRDANGNLREKDSFGRFSYRIMDYQKNGQDLLIRRYNAKPFVPKGAKQMPTEMEKQEMKKQMEMPAKSPAQMAEEKRELLRQSIVKYPKKDKFMKKVGKRTELDTMAITKQPDFVMLKPKTEPTKMETTSTSSNNGMMVRFRVVKSGTIQSPSVKAREKVKEDVASGDIGFRCVMAYHGNQIVDKFKAKWDKQILIKR